jgi:two-component system, OmpR family, response regulator
MQILLIEDGDLLRDALSRGLCEERHDVVPPSNGSEGLRLATEQIFGFIISQILLPQADGFPLCKRLREQAVWAPVVMLNAKDGERNQEVPLDAGPHNYLQNPSPASFSKPTSVLRPDEGPSSPAIIPGYSD